MKKNILITITFMLFIIGCSSSYNWREQPDFDIKQAILWQQYYGPYLADDIKQKLAQYDAVVLGWYDGRHVPPEDLKMAGYYIAAMEVSPAHRQYHSWLTNIDEDLKLMNNTNYPGTWIMDIRDKSWQDLVINQGIPWTLNTNKGANERVFLLLDTFGDVKDFLANRYEYKQAAKEFIKRIHEAYPNIPLIVNEPNDLIYDIYPYIDGMVFEQVFYDITNGQPWSVPRGEWGNKQFNEIIAFRDSLPLAQKFTIFSMETIANNDLAKAQDVVNKAKALGLVPMLASFSSLGNRYQNLSDQYYQVLKKSLKGE